MQKNFHLPSKRQISYNTRKNEMLGEGAHVIHLCQCVVFVSMLPGANFWPT